MKDEVGVELPIIGLVRVDAYAPCYGYDASLPEGFRYLGAYPVAAFNERRHVLRFPVLGLVPVVDDNRE